MKNVFLGIAITICGILFTVIIMTLGSQATRRNELRDAVETAMVSTIENTYYGKTYMVADTQELIADFMETLLIQIESDSTIEVNVLDADAELGILSVEVVEHYKHPIGTEGTVRVQKTVLMEQYMNETTEEEA